MPPNQSLYKLFTERCKTFFRPGTAITEIFGDDYWKEKANYMAKWKGNVLLVKTDRFITLNRENPTYQDLGMSDVNEVVKFLWLHSNQQSDELKDLLTGLLVEGGNYDDDDDGDDDGDNDGDDDEE